MPLKAGAIASAFVVGLATFAAAQRQTVPLRGVIFDSLRGKPIRDAFVSIAGREQVITTDAFGRFQFDSVEPGVHRIVAQHASFDSIGLSGLSAHATVVTGTQEVHLAVPSFATLWRTVCPGTAPKDSGIVYGTIRDAARGTPVANAVVDVSWSELVLVDHHGVRERKWQIETHSNHEGQYAACGVAPDLNFELRAKAAERETGTIDLPALTTRLQRHDLFVGAASGGSSRESGTVAGTVTDVSGKPVADARVLVDSLPEVRTSDDGTFTVSNVPTGTRRVEVNAIGTSPSNLAIDVVPGNTARLSVTLRTVTSLAPVETRAERNVRVFRAEFAERRARGFGYARDSTQIERYGLFLNALRDVPSMNVQYRTPTLRITVPDGVGGQCAPRVLIDGADAAFGHLIDLESREVAAFEVVVRSAEIPPRYASVGIQSQCGMILVWTKYGMRNR